MKKPSVHEMVHIDGSFGEGGGQILRTSLSLSCVLGRTVEITNIRKSRRNPGLQPQHQTAVKAAAAVAGAAVEGAELSSTALRFLPKRTTGGTYRFDVAEKKSSAGSTSLVLQTILLPLCLAAEPSAVTFMGGTHVPWSPSFHYLSYIVAPLLSLLGARINLSLLRWGWYPLGRGEVSARISPADELQPLRVTHRGRLKRIFGLSAVSNLPEHIAKRQREQALRMLDAAGFPADIDVLSAPSPGKGSFLFLVTEFEHCSAGFGSLGAIGKRAEEVAKEACDELLTFVRLEGALDPYLADQIVPWLAFCQGTSEFTTSCITDHLLSNIWVVQQFMDVDVQIEGKTGDEGRVVIRPLTRDVLSPAGAVS